jgi:hypothetical protein
LAGVTDDGLRAVRAAALALARNDKPTALLMIASARSQLGLVDDRYAAPAWKRTAMPWLPPIWISGPCRIGFAVVEKTPRLAVQSGALAKAAH